MFGIYAAASAVGGFLGRFIPGMVTDYGGWRGPGPLMEYAGWRGGFLVLACGSLICLAIVALLLTPERKFVRATDFRTSLRQMLAHLATNSARSGLKKRQLAHKRVPNPAERRV